MKSLVYLFFALVALALVAPAFATNVVRQRVVVRQPVVRQRVVVQRQAVVVPHVQQLVVPAYGVQQFVAPQQFNAGGCHNGALQLNGGGCQALFR